MDLDPKQDNNNDSSDDSSDSGSDEVERIQPPPGEAIEVPVIGIVMQPMTRTVHEGITDRWFVMASYVKFVESTGAMAVPIDPGKDEDYLVHQLNSINGVLIPGGIPKLRTKEKEFTDYMVWTQFIYDHVKKINDDGTYYPLFAICLGFQMINLFESPDYETLTENTFKARDININLDFKIDPEETLLFKGWNPQLVANMKKKRIAWANNGDGIFYDNYLKNEKLTEAFNVVATSRDQLDQELVAVVEHKWYPIFAT